MVRSEKQFFNKYKKIKDKIKKKRWWNRNYFEMGRENLGGSNAEQTNTDHTLEETGLP